MPPADLGRMCGFSGSPGCTTPSAQQVATAPCSGRSWTATTDRTCLGEGVRDPGREGAVSHDPAPHQLPRRLRQLSYMVWGRKRARGILPFLFFKERVVVVRGPHTALPSRRPYTHFLTMPLTPGQLPAQGAPLARGEPAWGKEKEAGIFCSWIWQPKGTAVSAAPGRQQEGCSNRRGVVCGHALRPSRSKGLWRAARRTSPGNTSSREIRGHKRTSAVSGPVHVR